MRTGEHAPLLRPHGVWAGVGIVAAIGGAALRVALVPLFVTPVFDRVLAAGALDELPGWLAVGAAVVVASSALLYLQDVAFGQAAAYRTRVWRARLHDALLRAHPAPPATPPAAGWRPVSSATCARWRRTCCTGSARSSRRPPPSSPSWPC
jgi:hypothetical protein